MAALAQQLSWLHSPPLAPSPRDAALRLHLRPRRRSSLVVKAYVTPALTESQKFRQELKLLFEEANLRCHNKPTEGVSFSVQDFFKAVEENDVDHQLGDTVQGVISSVNVDGAYVEIGSKCAAFLPVEEACIHRIDHVAQAGLLPGLQEEFLLIGEVDEDDSFVMSFRSIQYEFAWERCRQLQAEDVTVRGKVVGGNLGGVAVYIEGIRGFVPFSQISSSQVTAEDLMDKELALKFVEVDQEMSRLVLSSRKAMADSQAQLGIGSVVVGTVQSLKPYGAFVDIGGINGLLHVSQISHDRVSDISTVLQPGDTLKVMILSHDRERGRVSLSTKKLEPTPGDMIRNPELVFEKADEMAQTFRQRIAQAEAMARADMLRFQPESGLSLSSDGILGPLISDMPADGLGLSELPQKDR